MNIKGSKIAGKEYLPVKYNQLINSIGKLLEDARKQVARTINTILVETYWEIGRRVVEYE